MDLLDNVSIFFTFLKIKLNMKSDKSKTMFSFKQGLKQLSHFFQITNRLIIFSLTHVDNCLIYIQSLHFMNFSYFYCINNCTCNWSC